MVSSRNECDQVKLLVHRHCCRKGLDRWTQRGEFLAKEPLRLTRKECLPPQARRLQALSRSSGSTVFNLPLALLDFADTLCFFKFLGWGQNIDLNLYFFRLSLNTEAGIQV